MKRLFPALFGAMMLLAQCAMAETFYAAPKGALLCPVPAGTAECPFATPAEALAAAKGGDTVLLLPGDYGYWEIKGKKPATPITIAAAEGKSARLERLKIHGDARNLVLRDLSIWPTAPETTQANRIDIGNSLNIVLDGLDVRGSADAHDYPTWTKAQWEARGFKGLQTRGAKGTIIRNSTFTGLGFAVVLWGEGELLENVRIAGFSQDGLRMLGPDTTARGNRIEDCVRIDANHPDGIQSWSQDGVPMAGLVIEDNVIINWANPVRSRLACDLQGIGFFDGFYDGLVIQNNTVATTAYHGISVYGLRNGRIINNTVVNSAGLAGGSPWLGVFAHKNKTPSSDVVVANNLAMSFKGTKDDANRVTAVANSSIKTPAAVFEAAAAFDYRPLPTSGFIDNADPALAPPYDQRGVRRGATPDRGALQGQCY
jgi:parallel beta-helix repeat protein